MGGYVARKERRGAYRGVVGKTERKRPLGRSRRIWENIKMDLQKWDRGSIGLAQNRD
jgi:hypothetical protein